MNGNKGKGDPLQGITGEVGTTERAMINDTISRVTPPGGELAIPGLDSEEDQETRNGHTSIKGGGSEVIVARPPVVTVTSEPEGEDEAEGKTVGVHVGKTGRHVGGGGQQHGPVHELQPSNVGELLGESPEEEWEKGTDKETPLNGGVESIVLATKDAGRSDGTPDDRG